jgi:hypothetical protein
MAFPPRVLQVGTGRSGVVGGNLAPEYAGHHAPPVHRLYAARRARRQPDAEIREMNGGPSGEAERVHGGPQAQPATDHPGHAELEAAHGNEGGERGKESGASAAQSV